MLETVNRYLEGNVFTVKSRQKGFLTSTTRIYCCPYVPTSHHVRVVAIFWKHRFAFYECHLPCNSWSNEQVSRLNTFGLRAL